MEEKFSKPGVGYVHFVPAKTEVGLTLSQHPIIVVHFLHTPGIWHFSSTVRSVSVSARRTRSVSGTAWIRTSQLV